jgi:ubiquinone/menaquinone biosynthesis C-methylase UbiE
MTNDLPEGRFADLSSELGPSTFDDEYTAIDGASLVWELAAEAFGAEYPVEVQPWGTTTWWLLGRLVAGLRMQPAQTLVDIGCGRGGPGLWMARATGAKLVGVDWSTVAIEQANIRASQFVPTGRARFRQGDLGDTKLTSASADAVICLDALPFAADRVAALAEAYRLLRPGGRYFATVPEASERRHPTQVSDWSTLVTAAGLVLEEKEVIPDFGERLRNLYAVWTANENALREELGETVANKLMDRADGAGIALDGQRQVLISAGKPRER